MLLITDALSLQLELIPTKGTSAKETANALFDVWFCRYGVPAEIISDRHKSFCGDLIQCLFKLCGAKHILISPRRPQSNGLSEQNNARIITAIKIHCNNYSDWYKLLPAIAGAYRASVTPTRQYCPFEIMYGCQMRLPVDLELSKNLPGHEREEIHADQFRDRMKILRTDAKDLAQLNREKTTATLNKSKTSHEFSVGDRVYIANEVIKPGQNKKFEPRFRGPYLVVAKSDHNTYKLSHLYTGKVLKSFIHYDKLRPSHTARQMRQQKQAKNADVKEARANVTVNTTQPNAVCFIDRYYGNEAHDSTRAMISQCKHTDLKEVSAKSQLVQNAYDDVTLTSEFFVLPSDNSILTVNDSRDNDIDYETVDEGDEGLHSYDDVCIKDMKKVLSIKRYKRRLRCCVLMKNGERILCSLLKVPTTLLTAFHLRRYHHKHRAR